MNETFDKILPYEARPTKYLTKFCPVKLGQNFVRFWAMEFQEKMLLRFTDLDCSFLNSEHQGWYLTSRVIVKVHLFCYVKKSLEFLPFFVGFSEFMNFSKVKSRYSVHKYKPSCQKHCSSVFPLIILLQTSVHNCI